jgi:hypothetical protein
MKRACLLATVLVILLSAGCGKKGAGLSGTFKWTPPTMPANDTTMTFQEDGTFVAKHNGPDHVGWAKWSGKGTYKLEGRNLSITMTEVNGKVTQGKESEANTVTLSADGKCFRRGEVEYIKQE